MRAKSTKRCDLGDGVLTVIRVSAELQVRLGSMEAELAERAAQADALNVQLEQTQQEKSQLEQQVASINSLLEASQSKTAEDSSQVRVCRSCPT